MIYSTKIKEARIKQLSVNIFEFARDFTFTSIFRVNRENARIKLYSYILLLPVFLFITKTIEICFLRAVDYCLLSLFTCSFSHVFPIFLLSGGTFLGIQLFNFRFVLSRHIERNLFPVSSLSMELLWNGVHSIRVSSSSRACTRRWRQRRRQEGRFEIAANRSTACAALVHSAHGPGHRLPGAFMVAPLHVTRQTNKGESSSLHLSREINKRTSWNNDDIDIVARDKHVHTYNLCAYVYTLGFAEKNVPIYFSWTIYWFRRR